MTGVAVVHVHDDVIRFLRVATVNLIQDNVNSDIRISFRASANRSAFRHDTPYVG